MRTWRPRRFSARHGWTNGGLDHLFTGVGSAEEPRPDSLDARLISMLTGAGVRGAARFASFGDDSWPQISGAAQSILAHSAKHGTSHLGGGRADLTSKLRRSWLRSSYGRARASRIRAESTEELGLEPEGAR